MDFRILQDTERQMLRDGKSSAAIDAMKTAYRQQVFNPDGYSQAAGLGSFASGGEAYGPPPVSGPVPQGINKNIGMADGGEVMDGIGSLNETARNMTRGPRGIGAYQQFADGEPPQVRPQSRPPQVRPQSRPPEMQEMAEIRSYLDGLPEAPSNLRPMARPEVEEKYFQINSYEVEGQMQNAIDFKDGMRLSMQDVENIIRGNRTATEPMIGRETGKEVLDFLQKNNPTSQEFIDYFSSARLAGGGEAYQQYADGGSVPRQTMIQNQPHMLAYINPEEERMLRENGGAGLPGPGGVPAYWNLFEPSTWKGGENYTPGAGFEGLTSGSSNSAPAASQPITRSATTPTFDNLTAAANAGYHGQAVNIAGKGLQKVEFADSNYDKKMSNVSAAGPKESAGITTLSAKTYNKAKDIFNPNSKAIAAMRGSGIAGNPSDPRNQGLTMFPGPISLGLKGLAYLGGLRKTDPIVKVTDDKNVYQSRAGEFYIVNSVTGLPMMVESQDDLSLSSSAKERMDTMMEGMMNNSDESGPETGGVTTETGGVTTETGGITTETGGIYSGLPPAPEYITSSFVPNTQMFAEGGPVFMKNAGSVEVAARRASNEDLDNLSAMIKSNYGFDPVSVALEQGIDPELALRVMYEESKGKQSAGSEKGARGLMQLMPGTAKELGVNIDDALENYTGGLRYLKKMTNQFGLELGLAAYNAGPGNVTEYGGVPPFKETQNYLRIIAEPFTGNSVESIINTGAENFIMNQPVFNAEDVARGRGVRPPKRPLFIDQQYYEGIRPQSRPESMYPAMDQGVEDAVMEAIQGQNLEDKYSVGNMEQQLSGPQMRPGPGGIVEQQLSGPQMRPGPGGIMSAIR